MVKTLEDRLLVFFGLQSGKSETKQYDVCFFLTNENALTGQFLSFAAHFVQLQRCPQGSNAAYKSKSKH